MITASIDHYIYRGIVENDILSVGMALCRKKCKQELNMSLMVSAEFGRYDIAVLLLKYGANVNERYMSWTPLINAIVEGHTEIVKLLLEHGADVNFGIPSRNKYPLFTASLVGNIDIIKLLVDHGAKFDV